MTITYIDPLEKLQENLSGLGKGLGGIGRNVKRRKRVEEILSSMTPEEQKLFAGYQDPEELAKAKILYSNTQTDNQREDTKFKYQQDKDKQAATAKEAEDEYNRAKTEYNDLGILTDDQYVERINQLNKKYGKDYSYEANPEYDPKASGDKAKPKYRVQGLTKPEKETQTYKDKKSFDDTVEAKKEVRSLKDKTTFEGTQQKNKIQAIKATGSEARKTKGTPTYQEKIDNAPEPKSKDDLIFEQINRRLKEKFGG